MIENIIFDIGNVLMEFNDDKTISYFTNKEDEIKFLKKEVILNNEWQLLDTGKLSINEAVNIINNRVNHKYDKLVYEFMHNWYRKRGWNKTIELINKLKENKYKVYILSNISKDVWNYIKNNEIFDNIDGIVVSYKIGIIKPNKEIYKYIIDKYNLNPNKCLFIDDKLDNIITANNLGIKGRVVQKDNYNDVLELLREYNIKL